MITEPETGAKRLRLGGAWLSAVFIIVFWTAPTTLYCWEGAYNVSLGDPPDRGFIAVLIVMGLVPWLFAGLYFAPMRRRQSFASALTFSTMVMAIVTLPILILRILFAAPFF